LVAAGACLVVFAVLAVAVERGGLLDFDRASLIVLRSAADASVIAGPRWFGPLMNDVTALGGAPVLTLLTALLTGYLIVRRRWTNLALLIVVVVGQSLVVDQLKEFFDRPRPEIVPRLQKVSNLSFPSGHAASSASVYLLLAAMLAPSLPNRAARLYALMSAALLALLVGMSRVALGVHYPTDVLAGWSFGLAWTIFWVSAARRAGWLGR
ncbi:MAG: phosphatase PAP2 family protein, partial [Parvularculaceae bacterium]